MKLVWCKNESVKEVKGTSWQSRGFWCTFLKNEKKYQNRLNLIVQINYYSLRRACVTHT